MSTRTIRTCAPLGTDPSRPHSADGRRGPHPDARLGQLRAHRRLRLECEWPRVGDRAALSGGFANKFDRLRVRSSSSGSTRSAARSRSGPSWRVTVAESRACPGQRRQARRQTDHPRVLREAPAATSGGREARPDRAGCHGVRPPPRARAEPRPCRAAALGPVRGHERIARVRLPLHARGGARGWRASAVNMSATIGSELIAMATCSPARPGLSERWRTLELRAGGTRSTTLRCFPGTEPWSGGFESDVRAPGAGAHDAGAPGDEAERQPRVERRCLRGSARPPSSGSTSTAGPRS